MFGEDLKKPVGNSLVRGRPIEAIGQIIQKDFNLNGLSLYTIHNTALGVF